MMNVRHLNSIFFISKKESNSTATEKGGFTLAEILVAMAIASIVLAAAMSLFTTLNKSYTKQAVAADIQQVVRAGIDYMAENIRMAGLDPEQSGLFGIDESSDSDSITYRADLNLNGIRDDASELFSYYLDGSQVKQSADSSIDALVDNVTDLTFTYLDADDLETTVTDGIRTVQISMTVEEPAGASGTLTRTYATRVKCRNLGL